METRRSFIGKTAFAGISCIIAAGHAPAFAQDLKMLKIGQLGLGSHSFVGRFNNPPEEYKDKVRCKPYAVWDDVPEAAEVLKKNCGFEKIIKDPVELVKESDVIHVEHADTRMVFELAQPALEAGKPTFINRPFTSTIADAEEVVRLARTCDAPLMCASSLEFGDDVADMQTFRKEKGPVRAYEAYCCEPHFTWHFPHVINYAYAALGGGIGATLPSMGSGAGFDYNAATLGGLGGYQMGPSLANWGTQTAGKLGDALKPQGLTTPVSQPFGRPGQGTIEILHRLA